MKENQNFIKSPYIAKIILFYLFFGGDVQRLRMSLLPDNACTITISSDLYNVETLDLSNHGAIAVHGLEFCTRLSSLDLSGNLLTFCPELPSSLVNLNLSGNPLCPVFTLPSTPSLSSLSLASTPIISITIPPSLALRSLILDDTLLARLPPLPPTLTSVSLLNVPLVSGAFKLVGAQTRATFVVSERQVALQEQGTTRGSIVVGSAGKSANDRESTNNVTRTRQNQATLRQTVPAPAATPAPFRPPTPTPAPAPTSAPAPAPQTSNPFSTEAFVEPEVSVWDVEGDFSVVNNEADVNEHEEAPSHLLETSKQLFTGSSSVWDTIPAKVKGRQTLRTAAERAQSGFRMPAHLSATYSGLVLDK